MILFPQELVNAVIHEIDDVPALKASCLAGSVFREETQRILFKKFKLDDEMRNPDAVYSLLQKSPHIAPYITSLSISFPSEETLPQNTESLLQIFDRLKNVQSCTVAHIPNAGIHAALVSAFLAFLSRQSLRELNVASTDSLLPVVCLRLITMAPAISFTGVTVTSLAQNVDFPVPDSQPAVPRMRQLTLGPQSQAVNALLARVQSQEYTQGLLHISLYCVYDLVIGLLPANARILEHIELNIRGALGAPIIPLLPALRSVKIHVNLRKHQTPGYSNLISTILDRSPLLADLALQFPPSKATDLYVSTELLRTLDTALVQHAAAPSIRWRLFLGLNPDSQKDGFNEFVAQVRRGMPRVDEKHRLVLEAYVMSARYAVGGIREEDLIGRYLHRSIENAPPPKRPTSHQGGQREPTSVDGTYGSVREALAPKREWSS
ncbi:hypothetical protein C8F04DRAFT_1067300 [Mycena alexandri]|uniref:Uncharacterized protein n=1 Tax=Mycena alexandri TaxID=1745969 RepID=A0AAD6XH18_9AGAR|nr:hypothetical protein C8F04DRAFT_1067300 [Mycena alexandri]